MEVETLELGRTFNDYVNDLDAGLHHMDVYKPFAEDEVVRVVMGGPQSPSAQMFFVDIGVRGANPPTCLSQTTTMTDEDGRVLGTNTVALNTYEMGPGLRTTKGFYLILDGLPYPSHHVQITSQAAGLTVTHSCVYE